MYSALEVNQNILQFQLFLESLSISCYFIGMITQQLSVFFEKAFIDAGADAALGFVQKADRPDLAHFQCNGALKAAKALGKNPRQIAEETIAAVQSADGAADVFEKMEIAGPGFINITLKPAYLTQCLSDMFAQSNFGMGSIGTGETVILDFGGPNVAKQMHVGHLRSTVIGDALQRVFRFTGHTAQSDVHYGDWGLPMGLIICEVQIRTPDLPYFDENWAGTFDPAHTLNLQELAEVYVAASVKSKEDEAFRDKARQATQQLQDGHAGYNALLQSFYEVTLEYTKGQFESMGVLFDLHNGEKDTADHIQTVLKGFADKNLSREDQGAIIVDLEEAEDKKPIPPLILVNKDGGVGYGTTDIATIYMRVNALAPPTKPDLPYLKPTQVYYIVDQRQHLHFEQVFRACNKVGYTANEHMEFLGFGTVNGPDGKPFKTRDGGVMTLAALIDLVVGKAKDRITEAGIIDKHPSLNIDEVAKQVGLAALKYADLSNHRISDYIFDVDRFTSFEGKTGPYIQYMIVRINSLKERAEEQGLTAGSILGQTEEVPLILSLLAFPDVINGVLRNKAPNILCDYLFDHAQKVSAFYEKHNIQQQADKAVAQSWLSVFSLSAEVLSTGLKLLGIDVPRKM